MIESLNRTAGAQRVGAGAALALTAGRTGKSFAEVVLSNNARVPLWSRWFLSHAQTGLLLAHDDGRRGGPRRTPTMVVRHADRRFAISSAIPSARRVSDDTLDTFRVGGACKASSSKGLTPTSPPWVRGTVPPDLSARTLQRGPRRRSHLPTRGGSSRPPFDGGRELPSRTRRHILPECLDAYSNRLEPAGRNARTAAAPRAGGGAGGLAVVRAEGLTAWAVVRWQQSRQLRCVQAALETHPRASSWFTTERDGGPVRPARPSAIRLFRSNPASLLGPGGSVRGRRERVLAV
jgi:hypothetical protein